MTGPLFLWSHLRNRPEKKPLQKHKNNIPKCQSNDLFLISEEKNKQNRTRYITRPPVKYQDNACVFPTTESRQDTFITLVYCSFFIAQLIRTSFRRHNKDIPMTVSINLGFGRRTENSFIDIRKYARTSSENVIASEILGFIIGFVIMRKIIPGIVWVNTQNSFVTIRRGNGTVSNNGMNTHHPDISNNGIMRPLACTYIKK